MSKEIIISRGKEVVGYKDRLEVELRKLFYL